MVLRGWGVTFIGAYVAILLMIVARFSHCRDECQGAVVLPIFFSFLVWIGAALLRRSCRADDRAKRWTIGDAITRIAMIPIGFFGVVIALIGVGILANAARDVFSAVTGSGLAPPGWHPSAADKLGNAKVGLNAAGFCLTIGLGTVFAASGLEWPSRASASSGSARYVPRASSGSGQAISSRLLMWMHLAALGLILLAALFRS